MPNLKQHIDARDVLCTLHALPSFSASGNGLADTIKVRSDSISCEENWSPALLKLLATPTVREVVLLFFSSQGLLFDISSAPWYAEELQTTVLCWRDDGDSRTVRRVLRVADTRICSPLRPKWAAQ